MNDEEWDAHGHSFSALFDMPGSAKSKRTAAVLERASGKRISALSFEDYALHFVFDDGFKMRIRDSAQYGGEVRFTTTDDDPGDFVGAEFLGIELLDEPEDEYGSEVQFLKVRTTKGTMTLANHNDHNGYYSGFGVVAEEETE